MEKSKITVGKAIIIILGFIIIVNVLDDIFRDFVNKVITPKENNYVYRDDTFSLITTPENRVLEETLLSFAKKHDFAINITYADNLEIVDKVNSGEKYDAIWASNSIWLDMLDKSIDKSDLKSTSITPITFGIKKSKVEELGLKDKQVTMKMLLNLIKEKKLTFSMANPITTNSGASSYLNILTTLAGNPDVLTSSHLKNSKLKEDVKSFFMGLTRTSGDEDFLEKSFINGDYDAAFTYESSIININKELVKQKKETLYAIYPIDGVIICDSPLVYLNNHNEEKKKNFLALQDYILEDAGQELLLNLGRRTWYGGTTNSAPKDTFNKEWGIDTTKYISPLKYPNQDVIREALLLYQEELRKPVHVVFCLDYSGSMYGDGINELRNAMNYIFSDQAKSNLIQFSSNDKIDVLAFASSVNSPWSAKGSDMKDLLDKINHHEVNGATSLYPATEEALKILKNETSEYNVSVVVMTDGAGNIGTFSDLSNTYKSIGREIPIYSITFGDAREDQLNKLSSLSNGKVFDGRRSLIEAFKMVRGYN